MDQPIACTLTTDEYRGRTDDLAALAGRALRSREQTAEGEAPDLHRHRGDRARAARRDRR